MAEEGTMPTVTWLERDQWSTPTPRPKDHPPGALAPRFERRGSDLVLVVPIGHDEARNGALIIVPTPGAPVRLRVPPGTESGKQFRVPRANAPAPDGFGDLIIVVEVTRPIDMRDLDAPAKEPEAAAPEPAPEPPPATPAKSVRLRMDRPPLR
jgi:DnaJ-class molecular chaperone